MFAIQRVAAAQSEAFVDLWNWSLETHKILTGFGHVGAMPIDVLARQLKLEVVPWLMLAAALRLVAYFHAKVALPAIVLASFALFLAFLLAARRMIEWAESCTQLGTLGFIEQLALARTILRRVVVLLVIVSLLVFIFVSRELAPAMLLGCDGIAFDQRSKLGMVWSSILAAIVLLLVVQAGAGEKISLSGALKDLVARRAWLLPAIAAVAIAQLGLSFVQGAVRHLVALFAQTDAPAIVINLVFFAFIFGFATIRLCATLAILTFALRESYRGPSPAPPAPIGGSEASS
jgi:hypothetical protein